MSRWSASRDDRPTQIAALLMAAGVLGVLGAPVAILLQHPDLTTRAGRHLLAGALGITALVFVEVLICAGPLRRGEGWALWAAALPLLVLGLPMLVVDATFVPPRTRIATLLPQALGDAFAAAILLYLVWRRRRRVRT